MVSRDASRPNIVLIQTDDQGAWAMPHRCPELIAPNILELVESGVDFENFYCASPVCSPARASLLTGRMPSAHGVHDWIRGEAYGGQDARGYLEGLSTIPALLSTQGWVCGHSGKWHLGDSRTPAEGFSYWYAHRTGDGEYLGAPVWKNGEKAEEKRYITEAITEEALGFIGQQLDSHEPLYLEVNYTAPHSPWINQHPEKYTQLYEGNAFDSIPQMATNSWFSWEPGPISDAMVDPGPSLVGYFAAISAVDDGVGRLMEALKTEGLTDATCVVFTSDNGFSCGHHGIWGKGNATWPLNVWEESVRVPFVLTMPGRIQEGVPNRTLASACDVLPTLLELAGVPVPEDPLLAGKSLLPVLDRAASSEGSDCVFTFDEYGGTRMIRTERWKYVVRAQRGPQELYDLNADPAEERNLATEEDLQSVVANLKEQLNSWFEAHTDRELDAFYQPVTGRGQMRPLRNAPSGEPYFHSGQGEIRER